MNKNKSLISIYYPQNPKKIIEGNRVLLFVIVLIICTALIIPYSEAQNLNNIQVLRPDKVVGTDMENIFILNQAYRVRYNEFDNLLYVVDFKDNDIKIFDTDLNYIKKVGRSGQGPGEFRAPFHIAFGQDGKIFVADLVNTRIQIFDKDFNSLATIIHQFGHYGFDYIEVDSKGNIYTCSNKYGEKLFVVYNIKGEIIDKFGEPLLSQKDGYQNNASQLKFVNKVYFAIDQNDEVYCVFQLKPIIQKYSSSHELIFQEDLSSLEQAKKMKKYYESNKSPATIISYTSYLTLDESYIYVKLRHPDKKNIACNQVYILRKEDAKIVNKKNIRVNLDLQNTEFIFYLEPSHPEYLYFTEVVSCSLSRIKKSDINYMNK